MESTTSSNNASSHILQRIPFDPSDFFGAGWASIVEHVGPLREGSTLDAEKIVQKDYVLSGESIITGEERLLRIKAASDITQLDGEDFLALYKEPGQKTLFWLNEKHAITFLSFWGIVLQRGRGRRFVLYLYLNDDSTWRWDLMPLEEVWAGEIFVSTLVG